MNYSTTIARLQRHQHRRAPDNFLKLKQKILRSVKRIYTVWILIHATWTVSYTLE